MTRALTSLILCAGAALAEPVAVRHSEGLVHGFLRLGAPDGKVLASGDLTQAARGDRVTSHLVFRFTDGSLHDETAVFSQRKAFRLLTYHLVQKGPAFERSTDLTIDAATGQVTVRYTEDGKEKVDTDRMELPPDLANGIVLTLLKNIDPKAAETTVSMVASTPKPRLVKLVIKPQDQEPFTVAGRKRSATHFVIHVDIGGITGALASVFGKQPPDVHVWVLGGVAPVFVKSEGPLAAGGPVWRIELASPVWPRPARPASDGGAK